MDSARRHGGGDNTARKLSETSGFVVFERSEHEPPKRGGSGRTSGLAGSLGPTAIPRTDCKAVAGDEYRTGRATGRAVQRPVWPICAGSCFCFLAARFSFSVF